MARWHFGATQLDRRVARAVARHASPAVERPARLLTWAADEHVLYVMAGGLWLAARTGEERERRQTDHLALSVVVTAILPHLLKRLSTRNGRIGAWSMGAVMAFPARARPTMPFRPAMPCMWARSRPRSPGPIQSRRRSPGVLAASLQQRGSSCWRIG